LSGYSSSLCSGLEKYPEVLKRFTKALQIYQSGETNRYPHLLYELRLSLEQFFKKVFNSQKTLEKQLSKDEIKNYFKAKRIHSQIGNLYHELVNKYKDYQNGTVKHPNDSPDEIFFSDEVEFMIYLTGNFMRLLLQIQEKDNEN